MKDGYVYIMTNRWKSVFYIGVTSDLVVRVYQHKYESGSQFTSKYQCYYLMAFEQFDDISAVIEREKQMKNWKRVRKIKWIYSQNPDFIDLYKSVCNGTFLYIQPQISKVDENQFIDKWGRSNF
ncbi:GIY-YIG nuclease family protein [bacterium]|nr:MAG: GIY-YIG nuclease family protein [bacterium]